MKVEYVDHMGSDLSVVNAARVSFAKISKELDDRDEGLIRYLASTTTGPLSGTPASAFGSRLLFLLPVN